ncbi:hypothetical protein H7169_02100 [Candidatus Gracilibacteria bacterium]|nr:hypothetical protein [Candidatus Gracilibacteria bacterium]
MPDISTRINALVAYLFLGPIILLARKDTPLADPYVRGHAKQASIIIVTGAILFLVYRLLHTYLMFGIFGISIGLVVVTLIVSLTLLALMAGAYRAYHGISANETNWRSLSMPNNTITVGAYSEEEKVRIIASFIPWVGILIAHKYLTRETLIGRKLGSLFALMLLTSTIFFSGGTTTLTMIMTITYIGLIVATAAQLFGYSRFLEFEIYSRVPTYNELDAHIKASIVTIYDFCRIAFGGKKVSDYGTRYTLLLEQNNKIKSPTLPYFAPIWIVAIPGINLITLPSLWQAQYREYTPLILQGAMLTILTIWSYGLTSQMGLYLLWPILTLIVESQTNVLTRAPITSVIVDLYHGVTRGKEKIAEIKKNREEKIEYKYTIDSK